MEELTERQALILTLITTSVEQRGYPPTIRELSTWTGIKSTNGVTHHLNSLERKGAIQRGPGSRAIKVLEAA
jgi:repressor LexA